MKLSKLFQPRDPVFWLMVVFNLLSSVFAWSMRIEGIAPGLVFLFGLLALLNMIFGLLLAWRLLRQQT